MSFAEREGLITPKLIQLNSIDKSLRNRLYNAIHTYFNDMGNITELLCIVVDKIGEKIYSNNSINWDTIDELLFGKDDTIKWYMPYEIIEAFIYAQISYCNKCDYGDVANNCSCDEMDNLVSFIKHVNEVLENEKSGYRILNDIVVKISNETELESIKIASNTRYNPVNMHIRKAISLYSDKEQPDYENSIKESISAVESMCCIITESTGAQSTLGNTLKKLESKGVLIHSAMKSAFEKLYGYTSDQDGIRHGGIDFKGASEEDAKYMLVSCSAFVNYLNEKYIKSEM